MLAADVEWAGVDRRQFGRAVAMVPLLAVSCSSTRCKAKRKTFSYVTFCLVEFKSILGLESCQLTDASSFASDFEEVRLNYVVNLFR